MKTALLFVCYCLLLSATAFHWQNSGHIRWAMDCDFYGNDLRNVRSRGEHCGTLCQSDSACNHFTWSNYRGGTCWLKKGSGVSESRATGKGGAVCGYIRSTTPVKPVVPGKKGRLIWQDEFDSLDTARWKHLITAWRGGNNEFQYYTNRKENSYVRNGKLHIKPTLTADRFGQDFLYRGVLDLNREGCNLNLDGGCRVAAGAEIINPIQSARLVTSDSFSFTYGVIEVSAKMPKGDWLWPAIWMLPTDNAYGGWPRSGEIDIVESRGNADFVCWGKPYGRQQAGSALHWGPDPARNSWQKTHWEIIQKSPDFASAFHTYRVEWRPNGFRFFIDNKMIGSFTPPAGGFWEFGGFHGHNLWSRGSSMAPFDKRFHFVVNLAIGGNFFSDGCKNANYQKPWSASDSTSMKKFWESRHHWLPTWNAATEDNTLQIDWIRVYSLDS